MNAIFQHEKRLMVGMAVVAFVLYQIFNFLYLPANFVFPDEDRFYLAALKFVESGEFWTFNFRQWDMPGVALIYSPIALVASDKEGFILTARVFHSVLLLCNAWMIRAIAMLLFKNRLGALFAFVVVLFYPFFIYYQGLILSENLFIFFLTLGMYLLFRWGELGFGINRWLYLSVTVLTLSVYMKATLTFLPPLMIGFYYYINNWHKVRRSLKILSLASLCYAILMSPWWIRSYSLFNTVIPFTTTSSMNMYLGNNPKNKNGGCDWGTDAEIRLYSTYEISEMEYMKLYSNAVKKFISENPDRFVELVGLKFKRFWNIVPNHENYNRGMYRYISLFSYGLILLLAIAASMLYLHRFRQLSPIYVLIFYFTLVYSVTIASIRYRLPIEPFLIVLASGTVAYIWEYCSTRRNAGCGKHRRPSN